MHHVPARIISASPREVLENPLSSSRASGEGTSRTRSVALPATFPYGCNGEWGKIYTRNQGAMSGALFIVFNINGDPSKAQGYFKNINGQVADTFDITVQASEAKRQARRP